MQNRFYKEIHLFFFFLPDGEMIKTNIYTILTLLFRFLWVWIWYKAASWSACEVATIVRCALTVCAWVSYAWIYCDGCYFFFFFHFNFSFYAHISVQPTSSYVANTTHIYTPNDFLVFLPWPTLFPNGADTFLFRIHCACHLHNVINQLVIFVFCPNAEYLFFLVRIDQRLVLGISVSLWQFAWYLWHFQFWTHAFSYSYPSSSIPFAFVFIENSK